jgi:hypothetical protein
LFLRQKLYINNIVTIIIVISLITPVTFQLYNNKDLSMTTEYTIIKTCRVLVHPIVESRDRQCKLRTMQHITKLPLASAPLTVEREQEEEHLSEVLYPPCCTSHGRERESKRSISTSHGREHVHSCIG